MTVAVRHLGDDRYRVTMYVGVDERTGRQRQKTRVIHAPTLQRARRDASAVETAMRAELAEGLIARESVAGYVRQWLDENAQTKSPGTMASYRHYANGIVGQFGRMLMVDLKPRDVRSWYAKLATAGTSPATISHYHSVLRAICRQAWADGEVTKPATFGIKLARADHVAMRLPTERAFMSIIGNAHGDLATVQLLALATGMRRGELVALRWSDLHGRALHVARSLTEVRGSVKPGPTKGKRSRIVALDDGTMRMLAAHRAAQVGFAAQLGATVDKRSDRFMFADFRTDPRGRSPYAPTWVTHGWVRTCKVARVSGVRFHDLRHRHATTLLEAGVPLHVVSARLGHAQVSTTLNIYAKADAALDRAAARVIGRAMKALPAGD